MVTIFPLSQDNMLGFTLDGEVDEEGMRKLLMAVEAKVVTHGQLRLLGNIKNLSGIASYQSFWNVIKTKKELLEKIDRYAILTDHAWLSAVSSGLDWLTPRLQVKTFRLNEGERAHQWLQESGEERTAHAHSDPGESAALREIDLGDDRLLGLAIVGRIREADLDRINFLMEEKARHHGKIRLLLEIVNGEGVKSSNWWVDLKSSLKFYKHLERVAIIGDQSWLKTSVKLSDLLTPGLEMAAFSTAERNRAIGWLG
ncbi:STAS/SEC14 domain-containing protein [Lewinella sp. IMCC34183]|uniref:STAS/SEC14 domain-containing protein n=1 Tax=Lewinella sp. IMCC34183 TaxID=2248762 RepID=UPI000E220CEB|nr:STAS/SEC14 domain-containing protein [Lewinella sp. IMCC34183]